MSFRPPMAERVPEWCVFFSSVWRRDVAVRHAAAGSVKPSFNSRAFAAKFKAAGGKAKVLEHPEYGHHQHGVDGFETRQLMDFFELR